MKTTASIFSRKECNTPFSSFKNVLQNTHTVSGEMQNFDQNIGIAQSRIEKNFFTGSQIADSKNLDHRFHDCTTKHRNLPFLGVFAQILCEITSTGPKKLFGRGREFVNSQKNPTFYQKSPTFLLNADISRHTCAQNGRLAATKRRSQWCFYLPFNEILFVERLNGFYMYQILFIYFVERL